MRHSQSGGHGASLGQLSSWDYVGAEEKGKGGCRRGVGTDTVAEAQLSGTLCVEEMEGGGQGSPINPLGVQPNHGWDRLPHYWISPP